MKLLTVVFLTGLLAQLSLLEAQTLTTKPFHDFFRKLIEPPAPPPRPVRINQVAPKPQAPVIPPLTVNILGISGEEGARVAIIQFEGNQMLIEEGDEKPGIYKVLRIDEGKITFLHIKANKRQEVNF